ncbi:MAG: sigma-70 family RNA polymerase sigma factor, partial [Thermoanaerobaculia bacterium]
MTAPDRDPTAVHLRATDDLALLRRVAVREEAALTELYDRYAPLLLAVVRRILGAAAEAEEVLQEAFFQAWLQADRYDPSRSSVSTWLVLIARSRALDRLRARRSHDRARR